MTVLQAIQKAWKALDYVPNCPDCKGTGYPSGDYGGVHDTVFWRGQPEIVCYRCKGAGKV
jgi:hypothetical protein